MPTGNGQIEDVLKKVLGYTLGSGSTTLNLASTAGESSSGGSTGSTGPGQDIDTSLRPDTVRSSGPAWLIADERHEKYHSSGSAKPSFKEGALTFWRWMSGDWGSNIEWVTVWVGKKGDGDSASSNSSTVTDEKDSGSPLMNVGSAWTNVAKLIPQIAGAGTPFDPTTLRGINSALQAIGIWAGDVNINLTTEINGIDTKATNFRGSAAEAFRDRVWNARRGVEGLPYESMKWFGPLEQAFTSAANFVRQLQLDNDYWQGKSNPDDSRTLPGGEPPGVWVHPYLLLVAMFDGSYVFDTWDADNRNHSGGLWETGRIRGGQGYNADHDGWGEMLIRFPGWSGVTGDFPVLRAPSWVAIDKAVRTAWADRVQKSFAPSLANAQQMIEAFAAAQAVTLSRMPPQRPSRPPDLGADGGAGGDSGFDPNAWNDYFNDAFGGLNDNLVNGINGLGDGLNGLGDGINGLGDGLNGLGDGINGLGDGLNGLGDGLNNSFNDLAGGLNDGFNGLGDGLNGLGDGLNNGFNGLAGGLNDGFNGLGGDLGGLNDGINSGLTGLNNNLGDGFNSLGSGLNGLGDGIGNSLSGLNDGGTGSGSSIPSDLGPQTLGDLSPEQLDSLAQSGQLDSVPLTPEQLDELRQAGYDTTGLHSLGDLTPEELQSLQDAGQLNDVPLTPQQQQALQDAGLLPVTGAQGGGLTGLPDTGGVLSGTGGGLTGLPGDPTPSSMFPTQIDGQDVTPQLTDPATFGTAVGDIRQPMFQQVGGVGGGPVGGFGTQGVTLPGSAALGTTLNGVGSASGTGGDAGAARSTLGGGMPFLPGMGGMGGGFGGAQNQPKERQRNTWLTEDEEVWGTDPECAPAVVGRDDSPAEAEPTRRDRPDSFPELPGRGGGRVRRGR